MEVKELQNKADEIIKIMDRTLGINHDADKTIIHILEELGEIARQINNVNIRKIEQDKENLEEEIADVIILTIRLANIYNLDIEKAIINKIKKLKARYNL